MWARAEAERKDVGRSTLLLAKRSRTVLSVGEKEKVKPAALEHSGGVTKVPPKPKANMMHLSY